MTTLLIVDDSTYNRKLVKKIFAKMDFTFLEAINGREALTIIDETAIDCILLDLMMPVMDGFHFLESIYNSEIAIPVIVATADIQAETERECLAMGVSRVLHKPLNAAALQAAVLEVLGCSG